MDIFTNTSKIGIPVNVLVFSLASNSIVAVWSTVFNTLALVCQVLVPKQDDFPSNVFMICLLVSDLGVGLVSVPVHCYFMLILRNRTILASKILFSISMLFIFSGPCLIFVMSVDRMIAINYPLWYSTRIDKTKLNIVVLLLCIYLVGHTAWFCVLNERNDTTGLKTFYEYSHISLKIFLIVCFIIFVQSIYIICRLRRKERKMSRHVFKIKEHEYTSKQNTKRLRSAALLVFITIALWTPYFFAPEILQGLEHDVHKLWIREVALLCLHANSALDVFVYMRGRKRNMAAFRFLLTHAPWRWRELTQVVRSVGLVESYYCYQMIWI